MRALLLNSGLKTRVIANFGAGYEHIDLDAAKKANLVVTNTPDALTDATAELTMLLILMASRRAGEGERHCVQASGRVGRRRNCSARM